MKASLNTMKKSLALCLLAAGLCAAHAQTTLNPPQDRISDSAITADQVAYGQLQGRLHALNEGGRRVRDYHLSKAQCWLDVSLHEYTRNDRSAFPQEAMTESEKLIVAMERKATPLPMETPLVNGAARLRPDLWARALTLQSHAGFACAQMQAACGEVELVHAGNEHNQQQWRHAKPYVQIAEDLLAQGEAAASTCLPPMVVAPVVLPAPVPAPAPLPAAPQPVALSASVVFNFDRYTAGEMRAPSADSLKALVAQVKDGRLTVEKILLVGHADRMNGTGRRDYNQQLSRQRADTVRQVLTDAGLPGATMSFEYRGDTQPVAQCQGKYKRLAELQECLLPNRRVEVQLSGTRP
jgi:outer membrane protein OmpA-like peptidoglycan-associated protein